MAAETGESSDAVIKRFVVDSKYKGLESNVWIELNSLNDVLGNCVNLGQGFPDFQPAPDIVAELEKVCRPDPALYDLHQYARAYGHPRLVKAVAAFYSAAIGRTIDPMTEVLITGGAYGALFYAIMSNIGKGDEVVIIEPYFDCYEPMVRLAGGTPVFIPLTATGTSINSSENWTLDMKELEKMFNSKTKAIILNSPNNPLGKVFSLEELNVQTPEQEAVAVAMETELQNLGTIKSRFYKLSADLTQKRDFLAQAIKDAGMIPVIPQGGYFLLVNWRPLESTADLESESDQWDDFRFVKWLAKKKQLLGIPPSAFYSQEHKHLANDYIRFNFYKKTETLEKAKVILEGLKNSSK